MESDKAKDRKLKEGDLVLIRKSGMSEKWSQSWVGPFLIHKVNSPLSYQIDSGGNKKQVVHINR